MLHNYPPPMPLLNRWLRGAAQMNGNYGHLLFEQAVANDNTVVEELRPYFESAHLDARDVFHRAARIDLHPDADGPGADAQYPNCLPATAKKGLFGEVMAGLMTQAYRFIGGHQWTIPIFLFRYHAEVEAYIFDLARDPARVREVSGRHGNDFIALGIDPVRGEVVRFIAGEAKWRAALTPSAMNDMMLGSWTGPAGARVRSNDGVWNEMNRGLPAPQGLEQMHRLLCEKARDEYAEAIVSLDRALLIGAAPLPRTDLVFVAGNRAARRGAGQAYLPVAAPPPEYTAGRPLQVVELVLEGGVELIEQIYRSLWNNR
ncbi:aminotransferase [Mesorhizobium sp. M4B.F.Ca.ET.143.01.1.1]|nr:aminotransferase [Mesorhizobium sp. M4B.F.Ca.ET.143.01.1.1]TGV22750.1 aminotransferase [Mesorhizobium sp. M4B.F.Ca.ET.143.01.1.1]TIT98164.1 MAG: aminotransferase [Mesorhizobium sp.]TIU13805.1 MAG: aminotransferase [Mesorhizobium sp.]